MNNEFQKPAFPRAKQIMGNGADYHQIREEDGITKLEWITTQIAKELSTDPAYLSYDAVVQAAHEYATRIIKKCNT